MAQCECVPGCIFFNDKMAQMPIVADRMKQRYCLGDNDHCARHMVMKKLGKQSVPPDLYPSQIERASAIISGRPA